MVTVAEHPTLPGEAYATVRHRMQRGELRPDQAISRVRSPAEPGMSFLPVSEALLTQTKKKDVQQEPDVLLSDPMCSCRRLVSH